MNNFGFYDVMYCFSVNLVAMLFSCYSVCVASQVLVARGNSL